MTKICASDSYCCATLLGQRVHGRGGLDLRRELRRRQLQLVELEQQHQHQQRRAGTCTHNVCASGVKLKATCDACVEEICAKDSYCCNTKWDNVRVGEVASICGETWFSVSRRDD